MDTSPHTQSLPFDNELDLALLNYLHHIEDHITSVVILLLCSLAKKTYMGPLVFIAPSPMIVWSTEWLELTLHNIWNWAYVFGPFKGLLWFWQDFILRPIFMCKKKKEWCFPAFVLFSPVKTGNRKGQRNHIVLCNKVKSLWIFGLKMFILLYQLKQQGPFVADNRLT